MPNPELLRESTDEKSTTPLVDPFDLSLLRVDQNFGETCGVKKLLTTIPVRKPHAQDFVRVHPDENFRATVPLIELKTDRETFLVPKELAQNLPGETVIETLFTAINRQGVLFFWPCRVPAPDGRVLEWHRSAMEAALQATNRWVRVKANMSLGAYEIFVAEAELPDPIWPDLPFQEMLRIAFRDRYVDSFDHPVLRRLRGLL